MKYTCPYCQKDQETFKVTSEFPSDFNWMQAQEAPLMRDTDYFRTACCDACQKPIVLLKDDGEFSPYKTCEGLSLKQKVGVDCLHCAETLEVLIDGRFTPVGVPRQLNCPRCKQPLLLEIEEDGHVQLEQVSSQESPCPYCGDPIPLIGVLGDEPIASFCDSCDSVVAVLNEEELKILKSYENEEIIDEDFRVECPKCHAKNLPQISVHAESRTFHLSCAQCAQDVTYRFDDKNHLIVY